MNFDLGEESDAFRAEVREFLDEHVTDEVHEHVRRTGSMHHWGLHRALAAQGWLAAGWPVEFGGQGRDPLQTTALREELKARHAPVEGLGMTMLIANTIRLCGTEAMRQDVIPRAINGEILICLGYTETQGGSDVASARTRAVRDGDAWIVNGQKMFTTLAEEAHYCFLLTRTNPDAPKHKGLTTFLVPMDSPGIEVQPIQTIGGQRTNAVFYTDVRVQDAARVGEADGGWDVLMAALSYERSGIGEDRRMLDAAVAAAREPDAFGEVPIERPEVRAELARLAIHTEVAKLLGQRSCWVEARGGVPVVEGSMHKLFSAESHLAFSVTLTDVFGPDALREDDVFAENYRRAVILPIWGGASEVQRKIIAERGLGLPRGS